MSNTYNLYDNLYLADYRADVHVHSRKGKTKNKHSNAKTTRKIVQFKQKNMIEPNQWISSYDVYKSKADKKYTRMINKTIRSSGSDYKIFQAENEILTWENDLDNLTNFNKSTSFSNDWDYDCANDDYNYNCTEDDLDDNKSYSEFENEWDDLNWTSC